MDSDKNAHDAEYDATTEKSYVDSSRGNQSRKSRTRLIIIGVVTAVVIIAVVIVVVVVVTQRKKGDEAAQKESIEDENIEDETKRCGPFNVTYSESAPTFIMSSEASFYMTGCQISGNCWTRKQCYDCLEGPNRDKVGNLNHIPVCCPQCGRYGLSLSWTSCNCNNPGL